MAAIARAAGITPAVIYDHFGSKADLYTSLLESKTQGVLMSVGTAVAAAPPELAARMRAGADAFFAFVEQQEFAWLLLFRDPPADPELAAMHGRLANNATQGIAAFLRESAPPGLLDQPDAERDLEMLAQLLRTAQNGLAAWWYEHPEVSQEEVVAVSTALLWEGFRGFAERGAG